MDQRIVVVNLFFMLAKLNLNNDAIRVERLCTGTYNVFFQDNLIWKYLERNEFIECIRFKRKTKQELIEEKKVKDDQNKQVDRAGF